MNASAHTPAPLPTPVFAPTYDLFSFVSTPMQGEFAPPSGTFVDGLVAALAASFSLDEREKELATLLMFGRSIGAAARHLNVDGREAQERCRALFARTGTDGRAQLFEIALRLAAMTELSKHMLTRGR